MKDYLTVPEIAKRLRVGQAKVRQWIAMGDIDRRGVLNTGDAKRTRLIVAVRVVEAFEAKLSLGPIERIRRSQRRSDVIKFY